MELNHQSGIFKTLHASVLAVTTDPLMSSDQTASKNGIKIPILYDPNHQLGDRYQVHNVPGGPDMGPMDTHSIFIIGANGVIRWERISAHRMHVSVQAILAELKKME